MTRAHRISLALAFAVLGASPAVAQVSDSTAVSDPASGIASDTSAVVAPAARRVPIPPLLDAIPLSGDLVGIPPRDTLLAAGVTLGIPEVLGARPGAFVYGFGAPGWPDGVSWYGAPPHREALRYGVVAGGRDFTDAFTGRPRYDLLPLTLLAPLHDDGGTLRAAPRQFGGSVPVTEARYQASSDGLQSVGAFHAQERGAGWLRPIVGQRVAQSTRAGFLFYYGGAASNGAYPGSRLARARQTLFRLRLRAPGATLSLSNLHNRRTLGAHGGVEPFTSAYASIFGTLGATVRNATATRRTQRNDFEASARVQTRRFDAPSEAAFAWTRHELRYATGSVDETLRARADRIGVSASQPLAARGFAGLMVQPDIHGSVGWTNALGVTGGTEALAEAAAASRWDADVGVRADWRDDTWRGAARLGARYDGFHLHPDLAISIRLGDTSAFLAPFAEARLNGASMPWAFAQGWGGTLVRLGAVPASRVHFARLGAEARRGAWDASAAAWARATSRPVDLFAEEAAFAGNVIADTAAARSLGNATIWAGGTFDGGFRRDARRGIYASGSVTAQRLLATPTTLHGRLADALPALHTTARVGFRAILFERDLILDAALTARAWTRFRGRVYHPPTGLLAVAPEGGIVLGPSGVLGGELRMQVRVATLFVIYDNGLAQTEVQAGALLVPDYPLSPQHLRFGVYWPIDESE